MPHPNSIDRLFAYLIEFTTIQIIESVSVLAASLTLRKMQKPSFSHERGLYIYPGIELFLREATLQLSSPQERFTTQFGMDERGSTPP
jgi:hypothetical protein